MSPLLLKIYGYLYPFFLAIFTFFAPIHTLIAVVFALLIIDLLTGIAAARKRGERISSAGLRRTMSKILIYETAIVVGFLLQHLLGNLFPVANIVAAGFAVVEGTSLFENLNTISGKDLFRAAIVKLGSVNDSKQPSTKKENK
jgi:phage-related holin